jgi:hypothetical protein
MTKERASEGFVTLAPMSPELAGLAEIAEMLRVTKRTASNYAARPDFPEPLERLAATPVWLRDDVEEWAKQNLPLPPGRPKREG